MYLLGKSALLVSAVIYLTTPYFTGSVEFGVATPGLFYCYDCNSGSKFCPGDGTVPKDSPHVALTNCTQGDKCFVRENKRVSNTTIYRGCTKQYWLPRPLPADGCYDHNGDNFCMCSGDRCNQGPIGAKTGVAMNAHLKTASGDVIPPKVVPRGEEDTILCNVCNSGPTLSIGADPKDLNELCLADHSAAWKTTYKVNCTGRCITKTNVFKPDVEVFRECSDVWYQFPTPFPPDGCYEWYGDTVCLCNYDLCNALPLGKHSGIALDGHIETLGLGLGLGGAAMLSGSHGHILLGLSALGYLNGAFQWS